MMMTPKILNARRQLLNVSYGQLARYIGVSPQAVWLVLNGKSTSARVLTETDRFLSATTRTEEVR